MPPRSLSTHAAGGGDRPHGIGTVSEFNCPVALATEHQIAVIGELRTPRHGDRPDRPVLAVQVVSPL